MSVFFLLMFSCFDVVFQWDPEETYEIWVLVALPPEIL